MSKKRKTIDDKTLPLPGFDIFTRIVKMAAPDRTDAGSLSCINLMRAAIRAALKGTTLSVHQAAGEMSHLLGETVTAEMIYSWTRESDEINGRPGRHIPAEYIPAFVKVTGDSAIMEIMAEAAGFFTLPGPDALRAEIQKYDEAIARTKKAKQRRLRLLKEMEGSYE